MCVVLLLGLFSWNISPARRTKSAWRVFAVNKISSNAANESFDLIETVSLSAKPRWLSVAIRILKMLSSMFLQEWRHCIIYHIQSTNLNYSVNRWVCQEVVTSKNKFWIIEQARVRVVEWGEGSRFRMFFRFWGHLGWGDVSSISLWGWISKRLLRTTKNISMWRAIYLYFECACHGLCPKR